MATSDCWRCGQLGHYARKCTNKHQWEALEKAVKKGLNSDTAETAETVANLAVATAHRESWMPPLQEQSPDNVERYTEREETITLGNRESTILSYGRGNLSPPHNVMLAPDLAVNVGSTGTLGAEDHFTMHGDGKAHIFLREVAQPLREFCASNASRASMTATMMPDHLNELDQSLHQLAAQPVAEHHRPAGTDASHTTSVNVLFSGPELPRQPDAISAERF
jgi:hypothetical protein